MAFDVHSVKEHAGGPVNSTLSAIAIGGQDIRSDLNDETLAHLERFFFAVRRRLQPAQCAATRQDEKLYLPNSSRTGTFISLRLIQEEDMTMQGIPRQQAFGINPRKIETSSSR